MNKRYNLHDGICDVARFNQWVMSQEGVRKVHENRGRNFDYLAIYTFEDSVITYWGSGDWRDGAPVTVDVKSDLENNFNRICAGFERNFCK